MSFIRVGNGLATAALETQIKPSPSPTDVFVGSQLRRYKQSWSSGPYEATNPLGKRWVCSFL